MSLLENSIIIEPKLQAQFAVIFLHGLGGSGKEFVHIINHLNLPAKHAIKFILPNANKRLVSTHPGIKLPAWYDIYQLNKPGPEDQSGLKSSQAQLNELIATQSSLVGSKNIILAGFSQGGALALYTGLRYEAPLAGVIGIATYQPLAQTLPAEHCMLENNPNFAIMLAHGTADDIINHEVGEQTKDQLVNLGYNPAWFSYQDLGHSLNQQLVHDVGEFIKNTFA